MFDPNEAEEHRCIDAKRELRQRMRAVRQALPDRPQRSASITRRIVSLERVVRARRLLAYESVVGEVETAPLLSWCVDRGIETAFPEDVVDAGWPDVIIVPGTAFTVGGDRLGQGGGWYDRFLLGRNDDAMLIGLAFGPQLVDRLPVEPHDVTLHAVVTEDAVYLRSAATGR